MRSKRPESSGAKSIRRLDPHTQGGDTHATRAHQLCRLSELGTMQGTKKSKTNGNKNPLTVSWWGWQPCVTRAKGTHPTADDPRRTSSTLKAPGGWTIILTIMTNTSASQGKENKKQELSAGASLRSHAQDDTHHAPAGCATGVLEEGICGAQLPAAMASTNTQVAWVEQQTHSQDACQQRGRNDAG